MKKSSLIKSVVTGLAIAAVAASPALAYQDLRSPDTRDAALSAASQQPRQDLRMPDTRDAALSAASQQPRQDLRMPDTRDAANGRGTLSAPEVTVVKVVEPAPSNGGLDWGDVGIGAGGIAGLILIAGGGMLLVLNRRQTSLRRSQEAVAS
jgi:hypothetical protein